MSVVSQEKEECSLVLRAGLNVNAGARGYAASSLSFSLAPHMTGKKGPLPAEKVWDSDDPSFLVRKANRVAVWVCSPYQKKCSLQNCMQNQKHLTDHLEECTTKHLLVCWEEIAGCFKHQR